MPKKKTELSSAVVALISALLLSPPASAISLEKMVDYYVGPGDNTSLAPNQKLIESSLDSRLSQLSSYIKRQDDVIPATAGTKLSFELQRLESESERYRRSDGGYTRGETKLLVQDFDQLTGQINDVIARANKIVAYDDLNSKQAQLRNRLEEAAFDRKLTRAEADSMRFSLRWIDALKADLIAEGGFTQADYDKVSAAVERVDQRLTRWIQNDDSSLSSSAGKDL